MKGKIIYKAVFDVTRLGRHPSNIPRSTKKLIITINKHKTLFYHLTGDRGDVEPFLLRENYLLLPDLLGEIEIGIKSFFDNLLKSFSNEDVNIEIKKSFSITC